VGKKPDSICAQRAQDHRLSGQARCDILLRTAVFAALGRSNIEAEHAEVRKTARGEGCCQREGARAQARLSGTAPAKTRAS